MGVALHGGEGGGETALKKQISISKRGGDQKKIYEGETGREQKN